MQTRAIRRVAAVAESERGSRTARKKRTSWFEDIWEKHRKNDAVSIPAHFPLRHGTGG